MVRNRAIAATASTSRFTVVSLAKGIRTVIYCLRQRLFCIYLSSDGFLEIVNSMRLKSALEDFEANTLGGVPELLRRLSYLGSLHDGAGIYAHWGLAKLYGGEAAQDALRASHLVLLSQVLKKPLADLLNDALASCSTEHLTEAEFMARLSHSSPKPLSQAARAHLGSVLGALSALLENRNNANPRAASPPPPPAQESRPPADT